MILNDSEVTTRLESPLNLMNRLNNVRTKSTGMELFIPTRSTPEVVDEQVEDLIDENKIRLGLVRSKAIEVMHASLNSLHVRLPEVTKVKDLSSIARDMKTIITDENDGTKIQAQIVVYKPIVNDISKYDTLVVME